MSSSAGKLRRRRHRLFAEQEGRCHYCKCDMALFWRTPDHKFRGLLKVATIEHLRDRWDPTRQEPARQDQRLVLACVECNEGRGAERTAAQPIEELHRRAGNGHATP